ncbi:hypothetical protein IMCC21224_1551 [Puniceibacterium sp. IMCC21224]|uniref:Uncharacterized protein n=2 Tax=Salipiger TaxID=263377 RepID=A0A1G7JIQ2_9RHOB|nr:hypothetical protein IMCC21224_1551 [Puniceibacterium sp. IMCC21224]RAK18522.1 hypothetical protein ATI53_101227 [Salipiger aestuarii]SDF24788.1 hypothetical protein SAMN04488105_11586 [Salipiger thiooxidans]
MDAVADVQDARAEHGLHPVRQPDQVSTARAAVVHTLLWPRSRGPVPNDIAVIIYRYTLSHAGRTDPRRGRRTTSTCETRTAGNPRAGRTDPDDRRKKKHGKRHYGEKNHVSVKRKHRQLRGYMDLSQFRAAPSARLSVSLRRGPSDGALEAMISPTLWSTLRSHPGSRSCPPRMRRVVGTGAMPTRSGWSRKPWGTSAGLSDSAAASGEPACNRVPVSTRC